MFSVEVDIKVTIDVQNPFYSCQGDAVVIKGDYGTTRQMWCNKSGRLHRLGFMCDRFNLSPLGFDSSGLSNGGYFDLLDYRAQPRPWDDQDPFYPRAVRVWDNQPAYKKSQAFFLNIGNINSGGAFDEWRDGAVTNIYTFDVIGTATLSIKKP